MSFDLTNHMPPSVENKMSWASWMKLDEFIVLRIRILLCAIVFRLAWSSAYQMPRYMANGARMVPLHARGSLQEISWFPLMARIFSPCIMCWKGCSDANVLKSKLYWDILIISLCSQVLASFTSSRCLFSIVLFSLFNMIQQISCTDVDFCLIVD